LNGIGLVIFDEFHERSIHADLGLALTLNVQEQIREDLRVLIMSATMDETAVAAMLNNPAVIKSEGRMFAVATHYLSRPVEGYIEPSVVSSIMRALKDEIGDLLVFLPGQREIRRVQNLLEPALTESEQRTVVHLHLLFGDAAPDQQRAALSPAAYGSRKVILSTSVAETSLTIDGVRVVIDSGLARSARFDPRRGMSGLVTGPVSQAAADQRRGRAGRQAPGACYRLWTEQQHPQLPAYAQPEILVTDLAPLALELARWGSPGTEGLHFIDPPPPAHLLQARGLLERLRALAPDGKLTKHGEAMADLPVHPRYAHLLLRGKELGLGALACDVAALLEERDILRNDNDRDVDLHSRWYALHHGSARDKGGRDRILAQASHLRGLIGLTDRKEDERKLGILLALAYPERVAKHREGSGERFQLSGGTGAVLPKSGLLSKEKYLAVGDLDGIGAEGRIFLAEPISEQDIRSVFADQLTTAEEVHWDSREQLVVARRVTRFGEIELSETPLTSSEATAEAMLEGVRELGLSALPWTKHAESLRERSEFLRTRSVTPADWPDLSDEHLLRELHTWLGPYLDGMMRKSNLAKLDMSAIIESLFTYAQVKELDRLAPTHLTVPTGSLIPLEYPKEGPPILAVRIQEMFGQTETPIVAGGRVKVLIHLLSPGRRPLAVTQDLPSFWKNAYPDARKDMRGKYPKHYWPDNPLEAEPTRRVKKRM
jgi:ATP-dependent helicase HrpB